MVVLKGTDRLEKKLETFLVDQINKGILKEGDRLLSEREIGKRFNVSGVAVNKAMRKLIHDGVVVKIPRKGTFIKKAGDGVRTNTLGVLYCHGGGTDSMFSDPFYSRIFAGIDMQAGSNDQNIMFSYLLRNAQGSPIEILRDLLNKVDGLILVDMFPQVYRLLEKHLLEMEKPVVLVNYEGAHQCLDTVCVNSRENARMMTRYLINAGHRRIACVYHQAPEHETVHPNYANRIAGYREALEEAAIPFDASLLYDRQQPFFDQMMERPDRPTAVFCLGDDHALKVYDMARLAGVRIPDDLSIVGHDNIPESERMDPPLTTVHIPLADLGIMAVKRVIQKMEEQRQQQRTNFKMVLPGHMVVRESCGSK